jgi:hypothetical protein
MYHRASVGCGVTVDLGSPDVEELTNTSGRVSTTVIAELSASLDIVLIQERKVHVLRSGRKMAKSARGEDTNRGDTYTGCVICSIRRAKDQFVTIGSVETLQIRPFIRLARALLDESEVVVSVSEVLFAMVGPLDRGVNIPIHSTLEVGGPDL